MAAEKRFLIGEHGEILIGGRQIQQIAVHALQTGAQPGGKKGKRAAASGGQLPVQITVDNIKIVPKQNAACQKQQGCKKHCRLSLERNNTLL